MTGIIRQERIGGQTLILGDCLPAVFGAHVARLAKSDQITSGVSLLRRREFSKRFDVVNRKAFADLNATLRASPALVPDHFGPRNKPTPSSVGSRASHPIRSVRTFGFGGTAARRAAELCDPVLRGQPRLLTEARPAVAANKRNAIRPLMVCGAPNIFRLESIGWSLPLAELVAEQVRLRPCIQERPSLPRRAARCAAKPRACGPVGLDSVGGGTRFAGFFNHARIIARRGQMGNGTTLIACRRVQEVVDNPPLFTPAPPKPVQGVML